MQIPHTAGDDDSVAALAGYKWPLYLDGKTAKDWPRNVNMFCRLLLASHPFLLSGRSPAPTPNPLGNKKNRKGKKKQKSRRGERGNLIFLANPKFFLACFLIHCGKKW